MLVAKGSILCLQKHFLAIVFLSSSVSCFAALFIFDDHFSYVIFLLLRTLLAIVLFCEVEKCIMEFFRIFCLHFNIAGDDTYIC